MWASASFTAGAAAGAAGAGAGAAKAAATAARRCWSSAATAGSKAGTAADVLIIGAGILGSCTALELGRLGISSIVLDAGPAAGSGSTSYSSGILRTFYSTLQPTRVAWEGYHAYSNWRQHLGLHDVPDAELIKVRPTGGLMLNSPMAAAAIACMVQHHDTVGIPYELWDTATLQQRLKCDTSLFGPPKRLDDPGFGEPVPGASLDGALYCPNSSYVADPMLAAQNAQRAAVATGKASFRFGAAHEVTSIDYDAAHSRVAGVTTADGSAFTAQAVLNASGPHSQLVNDLAFPQAEVAAGTRPACDSKLRTRPMRVEVATLDGPGNGTYEDREGSFGPMMADLDTGFYLRPEVGGKVLVGGVEPECDTHTYLEHPRDLHPGFSEQHTAHMYRAALRLPDLPLSGAASTQGIVALYDTTPDWVPIYDKSALPGYYMAIGTSGNQFKSGPVVGALMANLIDSVETSQLDHDTTPLQHPLTYTAGLVDMAAFSRLRTNAATSGSVIA